MRHHAGVTAGINQVLGPETSLHLGGMKRGWSGQDRHCGRLGKIRVIAFAISALSSTWLLLHILSTSSP